MSAKYKTPYYREHEVPKGAYDKNSLPVQDHMDALMSMMNPTHQALRELENHLDDVFEKHHGGNCDDDMDEY
jgi:hypothetical protein